MVKYGEIKYNWKISALKKCKTRKKSIQTHVIYIKQKQNIYQTKTNCVNKYYERRKKI